MTDLRDQLADFEAAARRLTDGHVGEILRAAREAAGLTQQQLANRTGYAKSQIAHWEGGDHRPGSRALIRVFAQLGYDVAIIPRRSS